MGKAIDSSRHQWLESIFQSYRAQLIRYALKMTGDLELAREAVQDTFLALCREDQKKLSGREVRWLFTVCRNRIYDLKKKEKKVVLKVIDSNTPDRHNEPPSDAVAAKQSKSVIMSLIDALPQNQQEVLRLKFQNGLSYKEISQVTGLSVSNVGVQIHLGIAKLKREFEKIQGDDERTQGGAQ